MAASSAQRLLTLTGLPEGSLGLSRSGGRDFNSREAESIICLKKFQKGEKVS
jgi:hypothetical protein